MRYILIGIGLVLLLFAAGCIENSNSSTALQLSGVEGKGEVVMYKSPYCGCCSDYKEYLESYGYSVKVIELEEIESIKEKYSIPYSYRSCHTTIFGDYFVEGHVPIEAVDKLLSEKPRVDGIALPGMPAGSPGMPGVKRGVFRIFSITSGNAQLFDEI